MEAAAALDTMRVMKLIDDSRYARGIELLEAIVSMLTTMGATSKVAFTFRFTSTTSKPT